MKLYYGGAEIPTHRKWLTENGIENVYLSYMGLSRRVKFARPWLIGEKFPEDMHVLLDSGAYTVNREDADHDLDDIARMATGYEAFVAANQERVDCFTEFDALPLGLDWIESRRHDYYADFGDKFMPVWHVDAGVAGLERLASQFRRIGILQTALGDRDLVPVLNMLAERRGTLLYGLGITKQETIKEVRWEAVGSTRWIAPMQYGDTFVWTGRELKDYPKDYKESARKRHRTLFVRHGFDAEKIAAGDQPEIARLTLWSWQQFIEDINSHRKPARPASMLEPVTFSDSDESELRKPAPSAPTPRQRQLLPVVNLLDDTITIRGDNLRRCDTCFLKDRGCPGYQPGAECLYELPIEVKTAEELKAVESGLLAMQTQRVMFMKMTEDLEGGYPDPNLSSEIDRLTRMIKAHRDGTMVRTSLHIESNAPGAGMLRNLWGDEAADKMTAIEVPNPVDEIINQQVFDGEIVHEQG